MNKNYYAVIPASVRYDKDLKLGARLLYGEMTALSNEKGYCWATNKYFAELYQISVATTSAWINDLIKKNHISSKIIYKPNSKEIEERRLYIASPPLENLNTSPRKFEGGTPKNLNTPPLKNLKDNTTCFNNTDNNKSKTGVNENKLIVKTSFDLFWETYPYRVGKAAALKAWTKIKPSQELFDKIILSIENAKKSKEWLKDDGQWIPHPTTWLNRGGWDDELTPSKVEQKPQRHFVKTGVDDAGCDVGYWED